MGYFTSQRQLCLVALSIILAIVGCNENPNSTQEKNQNDPFSLPEDDKQNNPDNDAKSTNKKLHSGTGSKKNGGAPTGKGDTNDEALVHVEPSGTPLPTPSEVVTPAVEAEETAPTELLKEAKDPPPVTNPEDPNLNDLLFINQYSSRCLDVPGPKKEEGVTLHQWQCHGNDSQLFKLIPVPQSADEHGVRYQIKNKFSGLCLTLKEPSVISSEIVQKSCNPLSNVEKSQLFLRTTPPSFQGSYDFVYTTNTNWRCLTIVNEKAKETNRNEAKARLGSCNNAQSSFYTPQLVTNTIYSNNENGRKYLIVNTASSRCLTLEANTVATHKVCQKPTISNQVFALKRKSKKYSEETKTFNYTTEIALFGSGDWDEKNMLYHRTCLKTGYQCNDINTLGIGPGQEATTANDRVFKVNQVPNTNQFEIRFGQENIILGIEPYYTNQYSDSSNLFYEDSLKFFDSNLRETVFNNQSTFYPELKNESEFAQFHILQIK
jgi:hypothetical protein